MGFGGPLCGLELPERCKQGAKIDSEEISASADNPWPDPATNVFIMLQQDREKAAFLLPTLKKKGSCSFDILD